MKRMKDLFEVLDRQKVYHQANEGPFRGAELAKGPSSSG
ncbi:hypothetical protein JOC95_003207 [Bacillus tianshenii]|uniref:Uncharacterized protein n=1 Tax=Sutcliffiella tianshenii TaxID=1463404 RepID=A0ABS2P387_9BACI|nr:hypothetical protein [Bacillus tianshenii]